MVMKRLIAAAACALLLAACRQPDGPMPVPKGDQPNRVEDISRDLMNVARKDASAPSELHDDLAGLEGNPRPPARIKALAQSLVDAVSGKNLPAAEAKRIADLLFVAVSAGDLSAAQIEKAGTDLRDTLVKVGATPEAADRASGAAIALASDVTTNKKRWYQR